MDRIIKNYEKPVWDGPEPTLTPIYLRQPMTTFGSMMDTAEVLPNEELHKLPDRVWVVECGLYCDALMMNGWKSHSRCDVGRHRCYALTPERWVKETGEEASIIVKSYTWSSAAQLINYCRVKSFTWGGGQWSGFYRWQLLKSGTASIYAAMPGTTWAQDGLKRSGPEVVLSLIDDSGVLDFPVLSVHYKGEIAVEITQGIGGRGVIVSEQDYLANTKGLTAITADGV